MNLIESPSRAPAAPWFESDHLDSYMASADFDAETEGFVRSMARDGGAKVDVAGDIAGLCDRAVAETDFYFEDGETSRVHDAWRRSPAVRRLAANPTIHHLLRAAHGGAPIQDPSSTRRSLVIHFYFSGCTYSRR